jgi:hypothetical protein
MPASITVAICAITFSVPVMLWCLFLGRDKSRQTVRENLLRGSRNRPKPRQEDAAGRSPPQPAGSHSHAP